MKKSRDVRDGEHGVWAGAGDIRVHGGGNEQREAEQSRKSFSAMGQRVFVLGIICFVVVFGGMLLPPQLFTGTEYSGLFSSPAVFFSQLGGRVTSFLQFVTGGNDGFQFQFCGFVLSAMMGAALGMCGSVYQGALHNPLAAPKTLGVMSGGALGAFLYYLTPLATAGPAYISQSASSASIADYDRWLMSLDLLSRLWVEYGKALCSVAGCFLVVSLVVFVSASTGRGRLKNITVIIAGQIFSVGVSSLILYARTTYIAAGNADMAELLMQIENYALGGLYTMQDLALVGIPLALCMVAVLIMRNKLTMLSFGDEEAQSMGVNVNRWRYIMIAVCTFMTGWAISFMGHVAFLGFISAHVARRIVGPDMRYLLPASLFVGATFITFFYLLTTVGLGFAPQGSVGMWTSIVGAAVFLVMALRQRGRSENNWGE